VPRSPEKEPRLGRAAPAQVPKASAGLSNRVRASFVARLEDMLQPVQKPVVPAKKVRPKILDGDGDRDVDLEALKFGEAIGAGSFGAVHKATYGNQVVAVKQCKCGDPEDAAMIQDEIRYLQRLRHPRLVSFVGSCSKPPHVFLILEYMAGGSLSNVLFVKKKQLDLLQRATMGLQVCEGLAYLHDNSVVHRDLKTMNIVLDQQLNCKICDFGLTVTLERTHITIHALQGSPRYMAPEQFSKDAKITEKVDIWQMGCVFMELFCLVLPFSSCKSLEHVATELLFKKRPPSIPSDADPRARILIAACLRIQSEKRPSAAALTDVLDLVVAQQ
jgi:serine/threonine protein kinase